MPFLNGLNLNRDALANLSDNHATIVELERLLNLIRPNNNGTGIEAASGPSGSQMSGFRNKIINGAFDVNQITPSRIFSQNGDFLALDKWYIGSSGLTDPVLISNNTGPFDFSRSVKLQPTTAGVPSGSDRYVYFTQAIKGNDVRTLSNKCTLSFQVKSNLAGQKFSVAFRTLNALQSFMYDYKILKADEWQKESVTIDVNTNIGLNLVLDCLFCFHSGGLYNTPSIQKWVNGNFIASSFINSIFGSINNYVEIAAIQVESGDVATPFEHRPLSVENALCQFYYQNIGGFSNGIVLGTGQIASNNSVSLFSIPQSVPMRIAPQMSFNQLRIEHPSVGSFLVTGTISNNISPVRNCYSFFTAGSPFPNSIIGHAANLRLGDSGTGSYLTLDAN